MAPISSMFAVRSGWSINERPAKATQPGNANMQSREDLSERHRTVVAEAFASWGRGDSQPLFGLIADDVVWRLPGSIPGSGVFEGKEAFLEQSARPLHRRLRRSPVPKVDRIVSDDDVVVVQWHGEGETAHGAPYSNEYCWVLRFGDRDQIVEIVSYLDTQAVARVFEEG